MAANKKKKTKETGEIPAVPRQHSIPLAERPYLKTLGAVWNTSKAGQSFVAPVKKSSAKVPASSKTKEVKVIDKEGLSIKDINDPSLTHGDTLITGKVKGPFKTGVKLGTDL